MRRFSLYILTILIPFIIDASYGKADLSNPSNPVSRLSNQDKTKIIEGIIKEIGSIVSPYFYERQPGKWSFNSPDVKRNEKAEELFKHVLTFMDIDALDGYKTFQSIIKQHKEAIEQLKLLKFKGNWVLLARLWLYAFAKKSEFNAFYASADADAIKKEIAMTNVFKERIFQFLSSAGYNAPAILMEMLKTFEDRMDRLAKLLPEEESKEEKKQRSGSFLSQAQQEALIAQFVHPKSPTIEEKTQELQEPVIEKEKIEEQKQPPAQQAQGQQAVGQIPAEPAAQQAPAPENISQAQVAASVEPERAAIVLTEEQLKQPIDIATFKSSPQETIVEIARKRSLTTPELAFTKSDVALDNAICEARKADALAAGTKFKSDPCKRKR